MQDCDLRTGIPKMPKRPPTMPETRDQLEALLLESIEQLDCGEGIAGEEVLARLKEKSEAFRLLDSCRLNLRELLAHFSAPFARS